jgi:hypothetical protein
MKKSTHVPASLIAVLAAGVSLTGCQRREEGTLQCVDAQGNILTYADCNALNTPGAHWVQSGGLGGSAGGSGGGSVGGSGGGGGAGAGG